MAPRRPSWPGPAPRFEPTGAANQVVGPSAWHLPVTHGASVIGPSAATPGGPVSGARGTRCPGWMRRIGVVYSGAAGEVAVADCSLARWWRSGWRSSAVWGRSTPGAPGRSGGAGADWSWGAWAPSSASCRAAGPPGARCLTTTLLPRRAVWRPVGRGSSWWQVRHGGQTPAWPGWSRPTGPVDQEWPEQATGAGHRKGIHGWSCWHGCSRGAACAVRRRAHGGPPATAGQCAAHAPGAAGGRSPERRRDPARRGRAILRSQVPVQHQSEDEARPSWCGGPPSTRCRLTPRCWRSCPRLGRT
jgi:hypothetical protein